MKPLDPLPRRLLSRPRDERGYPVPFFVAMIRGADGIERPDFRVVDSAKFRTAVKARRCWVCGEPLGQWLAFAIGPMCAITRTTSEPPSHRECIEWSIRNCPFLANPQQGRDLRALPAETEAPAGVPLTRNAGVVCEWITRSFEIFTVPGPQRQPLITVGAPESVSWWREGRPATRVEVEASIDNGLAPLLALAKSEGTFAVEALGKQYEFAKGYFPEEVAP
jgi:hypothetical protein